jgi:hypothetical protein
MKPATNQGIEPMPTTKMVLAVALALGAGSSAATAQDCKAYPPGPERFACASQAHPGLLNKQERCKAEGQTMGLQPGRGGRFALEEFVSACMHRRAE